MIQPTSALLEKFGGSSKVLSSIAGAFLASWGKDFQEFELSMDAGDAVQASRSVHRLKGSLGYFANDEFFEQVSQLETVAKDGDLAEARRLQPAFEKNLREFVTQLGKMQEELD